jgi:hypothetical protein
VERTHSITEQVVLRQMAELLTKPAPT